MIAAQFNGPERSGNGGYVCGLLAEEHGGSGGGPVTAMLRVPPPLDTPLSWEHAPAGEGAAEVRLETHGGAVVGTAVAGELVREPVRFADAETVEAGRAAYPGFHHHPFDHCFTCGTARDDGDGLRIFTGPVGESHTAGPWEAHPAFAVDGLIPTPIAWAALDCPGGWAADFSAQAMVLGRMTAELLAPLEPGVRYHAGGRLDGREGRKFFTSTALHRPDGELVGRAEQVWIEVDPAAFA